MKKVVLFYLYIFSFINCTLEKRIINPPLLTKNNIAKKIVCYRPVRRNGPAMYIVEKENKIIAHNYGFGGGGWSLAPGAAAYIVKKLNQRLENSKLTKNEPIIVIGAGCIGLYTALELLNNDYTNITIIAKKFENLPSNHAGGLWSPFHIGNIFKQRDLIQEIGIYSLQHFRNMAEGKLKNFKRKGAKKMPAYFNCKSTTGLELYVKANGLKPAKKVLLDFQNGTKRKLFVYDDALLINTSFLMSTLTKYLKKHNVKFTNKTINSFDEIKAKIIMNCTGYGAKKLCNDNNMYTLQGHLLVLKNQNPENMNYLITVPFSKGTVNGYKVSRLFYIIPRHDENTPSGQIGVIGGTLVEGPEENSNNDNAEEFNKIIDRAKIFYGLK